jgi:hypothetical protein
MRVSTKKALCTVLCFQAVRIGHTDCSLVTSYYTTLTNKASPAFPTSLVVRHWKQHTNKAPSRRVNRSFNPPAPAELGGIVANKLCVDELCK